MKEEFAKSCYNIIVKVNKPVFSVEKQENKKIREKRKVIKNKRNRF